MAMNRTAWNSGEFRYILLRFDHHSARRWDSGEQQYADFVAADCRQTR